VLARVFASVTHHRLSRLGAFRKDRCDRGYMDQRCATRDQRGYPSGVDFVTQPMSRDAKQAGRSVQRRGFRWVLDFIHARNISDGSAFKPQAFRIQSCGLESFRLGLFAKNKTPRWDARRFADRFAGANRRMT